MPAALQRGRSLADAILQGVEWLRYQNLPGFDEQQARAWLQGVSSREFPEEAAVAAVEASKAAALVEASTAGTVVI